MKKAVMFCMLLPLINYAMDMEMDKAALQAFLSEINLQHVLEDTTLTPNHKMQCVETRLKEHAGEIDNATLAVTNAFNCVLHDHCVKEIAKEIQDASERIVFIEEHTANAGHYIQ